MSRLFVSPRDYDFISDVTKEMLQDVIGLRVWYYRIAQDVTVVDDTYNEASEVIFEDPILIDLFMRKEDHNVEVGKFGRQEWRTREIYFHYDTLMDVGLNPRDGDVFAWANQFYEIQELRTIGRIWGAVEYILGLEGKARQVQSGGINARIPHLPSLHANRMNEEHKWSQQRGLDTTPDGQPTNSRRRLVDKGVNEPDGQTVQDNVDNRPGASDGINAVTPAKIGKGGKTFNPSDDPYDDWF